MDIQFYDQPASYFQNKPHTEAELAFRADFIVKELSPRIPTKGELALMSYRFGADLASMVLYRSILQSRLHGPFITEISNYSRTHRDENQRHHVMVQGGRCFGLEVSRGSRSRFLANLADDALFSSEALETDDSQSVSTNARELWERIEKTPEPSIILMTYGRGSAEARMVFEKMAGRDELRKVKAWINLSGLVGGSQLYANIFSNTWRRKWLSLLGQFSGVNINGLQELSSEYPLWKRKTNYPNHMHIVNLFGIPRSESIHPSLRRNFKELEKFGPNDGVSLSWDSMVQPGLNYPIWNTDYFLRRKDCLRSISKILCFVAEQVEKKMERPHKELKDKALFELETHGFS